MKEEISLVAIGRSVGVLVLKGLMIILLNASFLHTHDFKKLYGERDTFSLIYFRIFAGYFFTAVLLPLTPSTRGLLYCVLLQPVIFPLSYNNKLKTASSIYQQA